VVVLVAVVVVVQPLRDALVGLAATYPPTRRMFTQTPSTTTSQLAGARLAAQPITPERMRPLREMVAVVEAVARRLRVALEELVQHPVVVAAAGVGLMETTTAATEARVLAAKSRYGCTDELSNAA